MKSRLSLYQWFPILLFAVLAAGCTHNEMQNKSHAPLCFNHDWEFYLSTDSSTFYSSDKPDIPWEKVDFPHTPVIEPLIVKDQWQGICWYRKKFYLPQDVNGNKLYLKFEGAMNVAEVWLNGVKKIKHVGGYLPFVIDFTREAHPGDTNLVVVRLDNRDNPVTGPKPLKQLDFNMYGGIYRDVYLMIKPPLHITDPIFADKTAGGGIFITYPEVNIKKAVVRIKTNVINETEQSMNFFLQYELWFDGKRAVPEKITEGNLPASQEREYTKDVAVKNPHLWFPESPALYTLVTKILRQGKILDIDSTHFGIRHFDITRDSFAINGKKMFLRGVNRHQEYPYIGYAMSDEAQYRDAKKIKYAGFDYVRLSHYLQSPAFLDACDELGLVVLDAILGWQYYSDDPLFQSHVVQTCHDLIRRDRNHPCVMAWEVSLNESWMPNDFIDRLVTAAHDEYPGDQCFTAGWEYYGYDIFLQARQHRLQHFEKPAKPYIVSEYGDWEYYAMNAGFNQNQWQDLKQDDRSSRQLLSSGEEHLLQQVTNIQEAHNDNLSTPAFADGYWAMFDYNRGYTDDLEASGVMSITRLPKFSYYFFKSQRDPNEISEKYQSGPMVFIASYWNNDSEPDVKVFSNCDEVELSLNGNVVGKQMPDTGRICNHLAHPPFTFHLNGFEPGLLEAKGFIRNDEVAYFAVRTPGEPTGLRLDADERGAPPRANAKDAVFVYARIVDTDSTVVPLNGIEIKFAVSGGATLISPEIVTTEAGIATALVRIGKEPGNVEIVASCNGFGGLEVKNLIIIH